MINLFLRWLVSAISLLIVAYFIPGIHVNGFTTALIAALVFGFINGTLGAVIKFFTFPFRILTLGVLSLVINAFMLMLSAQFVDGFKVNDFVAAFLGSILLSITNAVLSMIIPDGGKAEKK